MIPLQQQIKIYRSIVIVLLIIIGLFGILGYFSPCEKCKMITQVCGVDPSSQIIAYGENKCPEQEISCYDLMIEKAEEMGVGSKEKVSKLDINSLPNITFNK